MAQNRYNLQYVQLLVFPLAFLVIQILLRIDLRYFYLSWYDPSYAFLLNGLSLAQRNMELGLAMHPGTPLHMLVALNIIIINAFSGGTAIIDNVLTNPELYLSIISGEVILINTTALVFLGFMTWQRHHNLALSLALQLTPFVSLQGICFGSNVMLEPLLLCIEILMLSVLSTYAFGNRGRINNTDLAGLAVLTGLGLATKIVFIPLFFIPFFFIDSIRRKLFYIGIVLASFTLFLVPVYRVLPVFFGWIRDLLMHSGWYGTGENTIINFREYFRNMGLVFTGNYIFSTAFVLVLITWIITFIPRYRKQMNTGRRKILAGLALAFLLNVLMVSKHYSNHYLIISHNLAIFGFLLTLYIFSDLGMTGNLIKSSRMKISLAVLSGCFLLFSLIWQIQFSPNLKTPRMKALEYIESHFENNQKIIVLGDNSYPFIEAALYHGYAFSGGMKYRYLNWLKQKYPDTYFYFLRQDRLAHWDNEQNLAVLLSGSDITYLYTISKAGQLPTKLSAELNNLLAENSIISLQMVFKNAGTGEYIYEIKADRNRLLEKIVQHEITFCDCERLSADKRYFLSPDSIFSFDKGYLCSSEASFSGNHSIKLSQQQGFGLDTQIKALPGFYTVSAMRKSDDGHGFIVASDGPGNHFYRAIESSTGMLNGWEQVILNIEVPADMAGKPIFLCLWYPGKSTCYFDDLRIRYYEVR